MQQTLFMLDYLSDADLEWMARTGLRKAVPHGEVLVNQGVHTQSLFIILEGCAAVVVDGLGVIARLGAGEVMGEMSFVDSTPPSATVTADGSCTVLMLDKKDVHARLGADKGFAGRLYKALAIFLANRLRATVTRMKTSPAGEGEKGVAVIGGGVARSLETLMAARAA